MTIKRRLAAFRAPAIGGHYLFICLSLPTPSVGQMMGRRVGGAGERTEGGGGHNGGGDVFFLTME